MVAKARPGGGIDPTAAALAAIPSSHSATLLEQQRQQMIREDSAAKTLSLVGTPKLAKRPAASSGSSPSPSASSPTTGGGPPPVVTTTAPTPGTNRSIAWNMMPQFNFDPKTQFSCVDNIWTRESSWNQFAENASGAYGVAQALPFNKMPQAAWPASAGGRSDPSAQISWGLGYIKGTYGTPCDAWSFWQAHGWY
jgi:hypothetical protein